jgi:hypothetical protein
VPVEKVRTALESSRLDPDEAAELAKRNCFARAKNRLREQGIIDEVSNTSERWTWQLSSRYVSERKLNYEYRGQVWYDKKAQTIGSDKPVLLDEMNRLFDHYGEQYMASDVTRLVHRIFTKQYSILPLREAGGAYFVPAEHEELFRKVERFINAISGRVAWSYTNSESIKENTLEVLVERLKERLNALKAEADEAKITTDEDKKLTKRKARHRFKELKARIDAVRVFARSLKANADDLLSQASTDDVSLALLASTDTDVLASLAQSGKVSGVVADLARAAVDEDDIPAVSDERVRKAAAMLPPEVGDFTLPTVTRRESAPAPVV